MSVIDNYSFSRYNYNIFKNNVSIKQLLGQAECDVLGISITDNKNDIYAIDVAFHEGGLNYGSRRESTVMKVVAPIPPSSHIQNVEIYRKTQKLM